MSGTSNLVGGDRATETIGYNIRRAYKLLVQVIEESVAGEELSFSHWVALMQLRGGMVDTCGALSRCLDYDAGATTRLVDQLEERGMLSRLRSTEDRRVVHVALTDSGGAAADRLIRHMDGLWGTLLVDFAPEDSAMLLSLLQRLVTRLSVARDELSPARGD